MTAFRGPILLSAWLSTASLHYGRTQRSPLWHRGELTRTESFARMCNELPSSVTLEDNQAPPASGRSEDLH